MTLTANDPKLPEPFPAICKMWKCPITGFKIPKEPQKNLQWRVELLNRADKDEGFRGDLAAACKESTLFYINTFCWTYRQEEVDPVTHKTVPVKQAHVPFITWPIQDIAVNAIEEAIHKGDDRGLDKSRDMGATWLCLAIIDKYWLFRDDTQILILSRTEDYVDKAGNHKALFWKLDYLHEWLPSWMRPPDCLPGEKNRTSMHLKNEWNGSAVDGESTTINAARGDRRFIVFMDEFGAVQNGQAMRSATADVTPCRLINSTPRVGSEYSKWVLSGKLKVVKLPWWEHPEKGLGRYVVRDTITQKFKIRSPWYDNEVETRSPNEIAEELDMDHRGSGSLFFDSQVIEQHKTLFGAPPLRRLSINFKNDIHEALISRIIRGKNLDVLRIMPTLKKNELNIWVNLIDGRLDQSKTYTIGIDIGKGQGGKGSSNSVLSIKCDQTGEKVAELACSTIPPYEFAKKVAAICVWVGGSNPRKLPYVIWEANGPGWDFGRIFVLEYCYPFYYRDRIAGNIVDKQTKKYGWHSSRQKKEELLSLYRRKLAVGGYINHSIEALDEATTYIYFDSGAIGPSDLMEKPEAVMAAHGDRCIADALSNYSNKDVQKLQHESSRPPVNSSGYRRQQIMDRKKKTKQQNRKWRHPFNFTTKVS